MPTYQGPADSLVYEGQVIQRGQPVDARGKALERLKTLGHQFEGHEQAAGPAFVDQPQPPTIAMGANGGPITPAEVLASSSDHQAALHEAAMQQTADQEPAVREAAARPESRQAGGHR